MTMIVAVAAAMRMCLAIDLIGGPFGGCIILRPVASFGKL